MNSDGTTPCSQIDENTIKNDYKKRLFNFRIIDKKFVNSSPKLNEEIQQNNVNFNDLKI